ncbi:MAG TPA: hypothetical protein VEL74_03515 [Thermoanaerobaculia bacterium]|nr:hypothetical protein [Thermoanaerobaculia bacterium]
MKRTALFGLAALLLMATLAGAMPAETDENVATLFAPETPECGDAASAPEPYLAQATDFTCGLCSAPACQNSSPTTYCGITATGVKKYCQATTACTGEGILVRRCLCVVGGDIIP